MNQLQNVGQQEWQTEVFRSSLVRKLEEAIRDSGNPTHKPATEMEKQVFQRARNKEEYLSYIARLILHVRQQSSGQQGAGGDLDLGMQPMQQQMQMQQGQMMRMQGQSQMMGQQMPMQPGMSMQQQQQQQQRLMMQQQQQRMMIQQQQQHNQQSQIMQQQRPQGMSQGLLEQRLQQQQGMMMNRMPMGRGQQGQPGMGRPPPPGYIGGPTSTAPGQQQGPSPGPHYVQSPGTHMNPSPGQQRPVPSPVMNAPTPSPGGGINSNVNTPMGGAPDSVADREYMEKVKQLEKYIEPLRRMITKIGNDDQDRLTKMKKLLEILSNPEKRMPLATLQKCEDVLKKMNFPDVDTGPDGGDGGQSGSGSCSSSLNPLLEAVLKIRNTHSASQLNHSLNRTFLPPLRAVVGQEITLAPLPASPPDSEAEDEIPDVLQGEVARLQPRFKVWLSNAQPSGQAGSVLIVCQLDDTDLPAVPTIEVTIPSNYPSQPPFYPGGAPEYRATPFLIRVEEAFDSRLMRLPPKHTLSQLLTAWELSVRAACCLSSNQHILPSGPSMFSV